MEFGLFGEVRAAVDGTPRAVGHRRQRFVLAALLMEVNRPVPIDRLIERVWGDAAPKGVRTTLYSYIHHLRHAGVAITRRSGGYLLAADPLSIDVHLFGHLLSRARAEPETAAHLLASALRLWRGEPFEGMDSTWAMSLREDLRRRRLAAEHERNDLALADGRHRELLPELSASVAAHPLDERLAYQYMLAAYRCDMQAEALACFEELRGRLAEELGVDPGPDLRDLHHRILDADPTLVLRPVHVRPVPHQLPAPPPLFTGRAAELALLDRTLLSRHGGGNRMVVVCAIGGLGGIGKTWLATHWSHCHVDRYPDGQLYVNLRGFDPGGEPLQPATALRGFLDALGVAPAAIPERLEDQATLYRSIVADKRMLVVLDNASDTAQVTPLIPGSPSCAVLITSRRTLTGLTATHGATQLDLDVLSDREARDLLTRRIDPAVMAAEPAATTELLSYCAGLPLAIGIVAARIANRPGLPLASLAAELRDHTDRLDALDGGDQPTNIRAVLAWSYDTLTATATAALGLLALVPGPDIGLAAAAALTGTPVARTRTVIRELEQAHLVQQHRQDRYRMHDLVRLSAAEHANRSLPRTDQLAASARLASFYLNTAHAAERRMHPDRPPIDLTPPARHITPVEIIDAEQARRWFTAEHANLMAIHPLITRHWPDLGWQLAWTMDNFHNLGGHTDDAVTVWETALTGAQRNGLRHALLISHRLLGRAYAVRGPRSSALRHLHIALDIAEHEADRLSQGRIHLTLAMTWRNEGNYEQALHHATTALHHYRALEVEVWQIEPLLWVAECHAHLHHYELAREHVLAALQSIRRHPSQMYEAFALEILGRTAHHAGQLRDALEHYHHSLSLARSTGNTYAEGGILEFIAEIHAKTGDVERAQLAWQEARDIANAQHRALDAHRIQTRLDSLQLRAPRA